MKHVRVGVVATLFAAALLSAPAAGNAAATSFPSTAGTFHQFDGLQGDPSTTQAQAVAAASSADIVSALTVQIKQYGAAMRQANPHVLLFAYINGEASQSSECSTFPASWYLYNAKGGKVTSGTNGNCAMNPESTAVWNGYAGWIDYVRKQCAANLAAAPLANGCYVDQISSALNSGFATSLPVDPATGKTYVMSTWMNQMGKIGQAVQAYTGDPVIGNSYEGGSRYWGMPTNIVNNYQITGFESEHFLNALPSQWTGLSYWEKNIDMMIDGQSKGKMVLVGFTNAPATNQQTWQNYIAASYMIGNDGSAWLAFGTTKLAPYAVQSPLYALNLGAPKTTGSSVMSYQIAPGVFEREFAHGVAVVNLSGSSKTVSLGGTFQSPSGGTVTQITLANANGAVLQA